GARRGRRHGRAGRRRGGRWRRRGARRAGRDGDREQQRRNETKPHSVSMTYGRSATLRAMTSATLNDDFERRPYWHATMPDLPDRRGRPLPDSADVVVVGGGYTGITASRELARRGATVTLVE